MFLCHPLRTRCLISHSCSFLSSYFFLKPDGRFQESLKDHMHQGEVKCLVGRSGREHSTASPPMVISHGAQHSSVIYVPDHCQHYWCHQLYLMQQNVTHLNYMPKVAQMLKDLLYQNLSLEDTVVYDKPFSERASSGQSCSDPCCGVVPTLFIRGCPFAYSGPTSMWSCCNSDFWNFLVLHKCFWHHFTDMGSAKARHPLMQPPKSQGFCLC